MTAETSEAEFPDDPFSTQDNTGRDLDIEDLDQALVGAKMAVQETTRYTRASSVVGGLPKRSRFELVFVTPHGTTFIFMGANKRNAKRLHQAAESTFGYEDSTGLVKLFWSLDEGDGDAMYPLQLAVGEWQACQVGFNPGDVIELAEAVEMVRPKDGKTTFIPAGLHLTVARVWPEAEKPLICTTSDGKGVIHVDPEFVAAVVKDSWKATAQPGGAFLWDKKAKQWQTLFTPQPTYSTGGHGH